MGHLTRIANTVVQNLEKGHVQPHISDLIKELPEDCRGRWESFVGETLRETNRKNTVDLVSTHNLHSSSEDDDMESPFPSDLSIQQAFSDYQIQQMTANFVDQFGFNDEEFSEHDENINATFDRIAEIDFSIDADDNSASAAAFEACCKERIQQFDDCEEEEDIWEDREISYATQVKSRSRFGVSSSSGTSPKASVSNGKQGCGSANDNEEDESPVSTQTEPSTKYPLAQTSQNDSQEANDTAWSSVASNQTNMEHHGTEWTNFTEFQTICSLGNTEKTSEEKDCGSCGSSDSEEDVGHDKTENPLKLAGNQKDAAQTHSDVPVEAFDKLTITDTEASADSQTHTPDAENTTVTAKRSDAPSDATPNGPV